MSFFVFLWLWGVAMSVFLVVFVVVVIKLWCCLGWVAVGCRWGVMVVGGCYGRCGGCVCWMGVFVFLIVFLDCVSVQNVVFRWKSIADRWLRGFCCCVWLVSELFSVVFVDVRNGPMCVLGVK